MKNLVILGAGSGGTMLANRMVRRLPYSPRLLSPQSAEHADGAPDPADVEPCLPSGTHAHRR